MGRRTGCHANSAQDVVPVCEDGGDSWKLLASCIMGAMKMYKASECRFVR